MPAHSTVSSRIWGYDCGPHTNNLACCAGCLRRKLADAGAPDLIHTVRRGLPGFIRSASGFRTLLGKA
ncbi:helix-turn-helix domain-containing protein [Streptomyces sp. NPDC006602]|uniref:helix-turn-helix domain-containing protein n=1 Tax=Streptomyces sp. NPDC006602 TaxID=3364751 RepID=UPI00368E01F1